MQICAWGSDGVTQWPFLRRAPFEQLVSRKQSILPSHAFHVTDVAVRVSVQPAGLAVCHSAGKQTRVPVGLAVASCLPDWKLACRSRATSGPLVTCSGLGTLVRSPLHRITEANRVYSDIAKSFARAVALREAHSGFINRVKRRKLRSRFVRGL